MRKRSRLQVQSLEFLFVNDEAADVICKAKSLPHFPNLKKLAFLCQAACSFHGEYPLHHNVVWFQNFLKVHQNTLQSIEIELCTSIIHLLYRVPTLFRQLSLPRLCQISLRESTCRWIPNLDSEKLLNLPKHVRKLEITGSDHSTSHYYRDTRGVCQLLSSIENEEICQNLRELVIKQIEFKSFFLRSQMMVEGFQNLRKLTLCDLRMMYHLRADTLRVRNTHGALLPLLSRARHVKTLEMLNVYIPWIKDSNTFSRFVTTYFPILPELKLLVIELNSIHEIGLGIPRKGSKTLRNRFPKLQELLSPFRNSNQNGTIKLSFDSYKVIRNLYEFFPKVYANS